MRHTSVKLDMPCEFINIVPFNPQISKCQIKVCYVGDTPNRNKSIITKEVARKLANSLPGNPIVGYFNKDIQDFDEHTKTLTIEDGKLKIQSVTKPYGFIDLNAKCWFQKYIDDDTNEHEYLMTEGWLWTGQYPECQRVVTEGNNQSMELNKKIIDAYWSKDSNGNPKFFIINDALISALCILGEDEEPCFEGANITEPKIEFALDDDFKAEVKQMIYHLQQSLKEGGKSNMEMNKNSETLETQVEYKKEKEEETKKMTEQQDKEEKEDNKKTDNNTEDTSKEKEEEDKKKKTEFAEEKCPNCGKPISECTCEKKQEYKLEDIPEYTSLQTQYSALEEKYNALLEQTTALTETITSLKEFKVAAERKEKQELINQFCMLSDKDKEDVVANIDTYSLEDIENKLAVICFRNKVNFNLDEQNAEKDKDITTYNLQEVETVPAWVQAVAATQERL